MEDRLPRDENLCDLHLPEFRLAGETLLACGCNNSHSGNLSVRTGKRIVITRTGSMLASLGPQDLVVTGFELTESQRRRASSEWIIHRTIYASTPHTAIAHAHSRWAVLAGWLGDELVPLDVEGAYYFGRIPVVECTPATASEVTGQALATALSAKPVVILRGHGVFAVGDTLERAMQRITSVNDSAHLLVEARRLGLDTNELAGRDYLDFGNR